MHGKYIRKDSYGNVGGISSFWRWYTELPNGIKLVEVGKQPQREADNEKTWIASSFHPGGIITKTWSLTPDELKESINTAFEATLVYVGVDNIDAAIAELATIGFTAKKDGWAEKGYITS